MVYIPVYVGVPVYREAIQAVLGVLAYINCSARGSKGLAICPTHSYNYRVYQLGICWYNILEI